MKDTRHRLCFEQLPGFRIGISPKLYYFLTSFGPGSQTYYAGTEPFRLIISRRGKGLTSGG